MFIIAIVLVVVVADVVVVVVVVAILVHLARFVPAYSRRRRRHLLLPTHTRFFSLAQWSGVVRQFGWHWRNLVGDSFGWQRTNLYITQRQQQGEEATAIIIIIIIIDLEN